MTFISVVRTVHISAGSVALATFLIPLVTRKGSPVHRRAGWIYVSAMAVIGITSLLACAWRLAFDGPERRSLALFLAYLSVLAGNAAWTGIRALRFKNRAEPHRCPLDIGFPALVLILSAAMLRFGIVQETPLFVAFSAVGFFASIRTLRYWLRKPHTERHWMYQHMQSMVGSCIATLSAFLVVNARFLGVPDRWMIAAWLLPTVIGLPGVLIWVSLMKKKYQRPVAVAA